MTQIINDTTITDTAGAAGDDLTERIIADLRVTIGTMKCAMSQQLVRIGVSMAQLHIMYTLQRHGVMTMSRLADLAGVSLSNATGLVDRMEERGYLERTRVPEDRRVVLVHVTDAGRDLVEESDAVTDELLREVLSRLARSELPAIARAVADVRSALQATTTQPARNLHETPIGGERPR